MLWAYGVRKIYGIKGGYKGVMEPEKWFLGGIRNDLGCHGKTEMSGEIAEVEAMQRSWSGAKAYNKNSWLIIPVAGDKLLGSTWQTNQQLQIIGY